MNTTRVASRDTWSRDLDKTQIILCFISNCNLTEPFQIQIQRELKLNLFYKNGSILDLIENICQGWPE